MVVLLYVVVVPEARVNRVHRVVDKLIVAEDAKLIAQLSALMDVLVVILHVLLHVTVVVEHVPDAVVAEDNVKMLLIVVVAVHRLIKHARIVKLHVVFHVAPLAKTNLFNHAYRVERYVKEPYLRLRLRRVVKIKNKEGD